MILILTVFSLFMQLILLHEFLMNILFLTGQIIPLSKSEKSPFYKDELNNIKEFLSICEGLIASNQANIGIIDNTILIFCIAIKNEITSIDNEILILLKSGYKMMAIDSLVKIVKRMIKVDIGIRRSIYTEIAKKKQEGNYRFCYKITEAFTSSEVKEQLNALSAVFDNNDYKSCDSIEIERKSFFIAGVHLINVLY